jgi:phosphate transport system substrate-binding protein
MEIKVKIIKSVLFFILITVLSFLAFILFHFTIHRTALLILLFIFYISVTVHLILNIIIASKKLRVLITVPILCIFTILSIFGYQYYVNRIPIVREDYNLFREYIPFNPNNLLATLDVEPHLKITDNFPILDGATALFPVYASFVQAVYSNQIRYTLGNFLLHSTTARAYENLFDGKVDIIFCAAPSDLQFKMFQENNLELRMIPIGREAFVFFVNNRNPVNILTLENIHGIYSGMITNWRELNGRNQRIRVFQRPENSGSQTMLRKIMGDIPIIEPRMESIPGMMDIITFVANYRNFSNSIGFSFLFFATEMVRNEEIKLLSINGIYPSIETIQNNKYPFLDNFYAIFIDNEDKNENIEILIEWILSDQGQELIKRTGYVPIRGIF